MNESTSAAGQCRRCGKTVPPNAPEALCPRCLIELNLATETGPADKPPPQPPLPIAEVARLFPQLEILETLGRGGMGAVYKVRQPRLNRIAALKILSPEKQSDTQFASRFEREARTLAQMNHPNIVTIYDFGETGSHCHLLMEYVDGMSLRQLLQTRMLSPAEALEIVPRICEALQYAHQRGVVHRDIKPENILLNKQGRVKIADFGIARMTGPNDTASATEEKQVVGTPHYMAPEQVEKPGTVDHRADLYSLGVVFYEMLTGELPLGKFAPPSRVSTVRIDVRLDDVVLHALEKEPARRYQQANEIKGDVETIVTTNPQAPLPPMNTNTNKTLISAVVATGIIAFALFAWILWRDTHGPERAARLAQEGWALWENRQMPAAHAKFEEAVHASDKDATAWNGLGWAAFNMGNTKEAETAFEKVLTLEPTHAAALNGLGQIYLSQKKYDQAESYLLRAAPQAPAAWFGLARLYLAMEKFDEAAQWAGKIVDSGQGGPVAQEMLDAARNKQLSNALRAKLGL